MNAGGREMNRIPSFPDEANFIRMGTDSCPIDKNQIPGFRPRIQSQVAWKSENLRRPKCVGKVALQHSFPEALPFPSIQSFPTWSP
jgi:hypothetical protein